MKKQTVPRTELLGNLLLVRLVGSVKIAFKNKIKIESTKYFTDIMICLAWINSQNKEFKPFVENRLSEINKTTNKTDWHYCKTNENPADLISKQLPKPVQCVFSDLWLNGPEFHNELLPNYRHKS